MTTPVKKSNISLKSNIMVDGLKSLKESCPGDFAYLLYPRLFDSRTQGMHFSKQQIQEYQQTLRCFLCGRPCAGTCETE